MSSGARIGLVVTTVVVLVLAFVLLSPEDDDPADTANTPTTRAPSAPTGATTTATATTPSTAPQAPPAADHEPAAVRVRVRAGRPVGGVKTITVEKGERARFEVTSTDTSDEVHLHGYDISRDVKPGSRARFAFDAKAEGIFEIELEGSGTQIAKLVVEP